MKCEIVKNILLEARWGELDKTLKEQVNSHVAECVSCRTFLEEIWHADSIICKIENSEPKFENEEYICSQIMSKIELSQSFSSHSIKFYDRLEAWLSTRQVRLALTFIILIFSATYLYEEVSALNSVVTLESNLNKAGERYEANFSDNLPNLSVIYDLYKVVSGEKKFLNVSENWMFVNKDLLRQLLVNYDLLSPEQKKEFDQLRKKLTKEENEFIDQILKSVNGQK